jgi:hypothetical protein
MNMTDPKILFAEKTGFGFLHDYIEEIHRRARRRDEEELSKEDADSDQATEDRYERDME